MFHLVLLLCILLWLGVALGRNKTGHISSELFNSLEELSRIVDISYCVSTTGIQEPFQCLSHCSEFPNLELVTVSIPNYTCHADPHFTDMEYRTPPLRLVWLYRNLPLRP